MAATVAAVVLLLLAACGGRGEDAASREAARADHRAVKQATADLYPHLASATGDVSAEPEAVLLYAGCGMSGLFSGVKSYAAVATFRLTSECADSSAHVARSFEDRPDETIPLS